MSGKLDKFSFNLDRVKELGDYIEVELISQEKEKAQAAIKNFLKSLGIKNDQLDRRGYPEIVAAKQGYYSKGQK